MAVTRFCLVRHGETEWNACRRIQGSIDIDLNAMGRHQAESVALALAGVRFSALYSSDLRRAWNTARIIGRSIGLEPQSLPPLRERHYGIFEGLTSEEARRHYPEAYAYYERRDRHYAFESGESLTAFMERVSGALKTLAAAHSGETVAVVLHGGVLDAAYRFVADFPLENRRTFGIPNAGLNWLRFDGAQWQIDAWARTDHLIRSLDGATA